MYVACGVSVEELDLRSMSLDLRKVRETLGGVDVVGPQPESQRRRRERGLVMPAVSPTVGRSAPAKTTGLGPLQPTVGSTEGINFLNYPLNTGGTTSKYSFHHFEPGRPSWVHSGRWPVCY